MPDGTTLLSEPTFTVDVPAGGVAARVLEARADTLQQDPQIVWKDLSSTATLGDVTATSHGPKVIPPSGGYETARYGDRPFPVVPVDFSDRAHGAGSSAGRLATKINDPETPGSTFNLYQEMSYGQLFPHGTVPSDGVATAGWDYEPGFGFTQNSLEPDTCRGVTNAMLPTHQQIQPERIRDGWYQLPGSTDYYGDDAKGSALIGALAGVGALQDIDSACGPTGKAVFDAAQIADPEIDYNDYDTDKDGVVDFFMMVFPGVGGNGESQLSGYDNIWPHSSDLQGAYVDENGEKGYVSDDQLTDLEGRPLFWTDEGRSKKTTQDTGIPVLVRVGPYNVNPESAIEKASVISHEYGHSLGLPDYYSTGSRETYGSWTLMASDHSQNIDIVGKKELGWVVPRVLEPGQTLDADGWQDTKRDTNRIDWKQPDGTPYTLTGDGVHNGEAYAAPLPGRQIIDPSLVPSGDHVWWSRSGNDFGCPPSGGHNLDIALPALRDVPAGTPVTLTFKSRWDVEWDYDYGFVLATTDNGRSYKSYASANGYTTPASQNPNASGCQSQYGNGITGSSGSYEAGTQTVDRVTGTYADATFVDDSYDLTDLAGTPATLRLDLRHRPRPGPARLVHRRPRRQGRRHGDLRVRLRDGHRPGDLQRRLPRGPADGSGVHRRLAARLGLRGLAGRARLPARDARPLRLRPDRPGRERPRRADLRPGRLPRLHRREPRLRQRRHRQPAGPEPARRGARARQRHAEPRRRRLQAGPVVLRRGRRARRQLLGPVAGGRGVAVRLRLPRLRRDQPGGRRPRPRGPGHVRPRGRRGLPHRPGLRDVQLRLGRPRTMTPRARRP